MRRSLAPRCYIGCDRPARKGSRFCSVACAARYGEGIAGASDTEWCPVCRTWTPPQLCDHPEQHKEKERL